VAVLDRHTVERIVSQVKTLVKSLGRKDGSPLINGLMAEASRDYYLAYKKAVLDYILKDKDEMVRTGISLTFGKVVEWGRPLPRKEAGSVRVDLKQCKRHLELNHILYPDCLTRIYLENEKVSEIELFKRRKEGEYRPYSILYYIKRNVNQLNEGFNALCEGWVRTVAQIIEQQIDLKQESYQRMRQFFNSIHIIMSNKLKEVVYQAIAAISHELSSYGTHQGQTRSLLLINLTENNQTISFIDDIEKVFRFELLEIIDKIV
jgi:hypothetical protein